MAIYNAGAAAADKWALPLTGTFALLLTLLAGSVVSSAGLGFARNVRQLYRDLARVYSPGDKLFLFGFSRGAFTIRTLAGLIYSCGILDASTYRNDAEFSADARAAYQEYRQQYRVLLQKRNKLDAARIDELRKRFSVRIPEFDDEEKHGKLIEFMGVWDTVEAVGVPVPAVFELINRVIYPFKFPDRTLNPSVAHACHALALDEERETFAPVLWDEARTAKPERIEQVWFAGAHANVGGGYPREGMSLVALDWIMSKAEEHNLRFVPAEREVYRYRADVNDKIYNSRAGFGFFYRWVPRNVQKLCDDNGVTPRVHRSVFERIARGTEGYSPGCLPPDPDVISTTEPPALTKAISGLVRLQHGSAIPLVEREARLQWLRQYSHWFSLYGILVALISPLADFLSSPPLGPSELWTVAVRVAETLNNSAWTDLALKPLRAHPYLIAWLLGSLVMALAADERLRRRYSEFWGRDNMRLRLRNTLGLG